MSRRPRGWAAVMLAALVSATVSGCIDSEVPGGEGTITTTTTRIASVDLVDPKRDTNLTCQPTAGADPGAPDPQRILVADPNLLDALCALGLQSRVVASTTVGGSLPTFMGEQVHDLPTIGEKARPDVAMATAANPDLVLTTGDSPLADAMGSTEVVPIDPAQDWEKRFSAVAAAVGRTGAGEERLQAYRNGSKAVGDRIGARYSQASLVRFAKDSEIVEGTDAFAAQVLTDIGVQRPPGQREPDATVIDDKNFEIADGDVVYVSFQGAAGEKYGTSVMESDRWLDMGAPSWRRVLIVADDVWYSAGGLSAANVVLGNVRDSLN
ncbi:ABC transporter substrate-binding protein [Williamsia limnetica]|nr:ABC transporter substrate-binding protein [Williamsia limnetica]